MISIQFAKKQFPFVVEKCLIIYQVCNWIIIKISLYNLNIIVPTAENSKTGVALVRVVAIFIMIPLCLDRRFVSPSNFNKKEEVHGKITHF